MILSACIFIFACTAIGIGSTIYVSYKLGFDDGVASRCPSDRPVVDSLGCPLSDLQEMVKNSNFSTATKCRHEDWIRLSCNPKFRPQLPGASSQCVNGTWKFSKDFKCVPREPCRAFFEQWPSVTLLTHIPDNRKESFESGEEVEVQCRYNVTVGTDSVEERHEESFKCCDGIWRHASGVGCGYALCPALPDLANGSFRIGGGEIAFAECNTGFRREPQGMIFCDHGGRVDGTRKWTSKSQQWPSCVKYENNGEDSPDFKEAIPFILLVGALVLLITSTFIYFCRKYSTKKKALLILKSARRIDPERPYPVK